MRVEQYVSNDTCTGQPCFSPSPCNFNFVTESFPCSMPPAAVVHKLVDTKHNLVLCVLPTAGLRTATTAQQTGVRLTPGVMTTTVVPVAERPSWLMLWLPASMGHPVRWLAMQSEWGRNGQCLPALMHFNQGSCYHRVQCWMCIWSSGAFSASLGGFRRLINGEW
jgi:hypothetical protein